MIARIPASTGLREKGLFRRLSSLAGTGSPPSPLPGALIPATSLRLVTGRTPWPASRGVYRGVLRVTLPSSSTGGRTEDESERRWGVTRRRVV